MTALRWCQTCKRYKGPGHEKTEHVPSLFDQGETWFVGRTDGSQGEVVTGQVGYAPDYQSPKRVIPENTGYTPETVTIPAPPASELHRSTDPETSADAARMLGGRAGTMRRRLLATFGRRGALTADEVTLLAGYGPADGAWKRVSDLTNAGLIEPTGETRPGGSGRQQRVLRITPAGRDALGAG